MMTTHAIQYWLALAFAPGLNRHFIRTLETAQLSPLDLLSLPKAELKALGLNLLTIDALLNNPNTQQIEQHLNWMKHPMNTIIPWDHPDYPPLLKEISDPPLLLYVSGNAQLLSQPQLAMVGSRRPTPMGKETAFQFAKDLSQEGLIITSGLALGIDGASHRGALAAGKATIAVQACGMDQFYPHSHRELAAQILEHGAIISEQPLGTEPQRRLFPSRNRIVSGLCLGTLVVEAAQRSGSLITAYQALEQGRWIGAIPGSIHNPMSQGCHHLLREGAALITVPDDILTELNIKKAEKTKERTKIYQPTLDIAQQMLLECVGFEATPLDIICARSDMETSQLWPELLQLELKGFVSSIPGGYTRLKT